MARVALEQACQRAGSMVFEASRQRQYPREPMMSSVVELMMLVSLGLRPSLHAAARWSSCRCRWPRCDDKVNPHGACGAARLGAGQRGASGAGDGATRRRGESGGWRLRILDGNHLPASHKRLAPLLIGVARPSGTRWWSRSRPGPGHGHRGARTRTRASVPWRGHWWPVHGQGSCGWPTVISAPAPCCGGSRRNRLHRA